MFVVFASTDPGAKGRGLSMFIVGKDTPGLTTGIPLKKYGNHDAPTGELFFDDCRVPEANLLGKENQGFSQMLFPWDGNESHSPLCRPDGE